MRFNTLVTRSVFSESNPNDGERILIMAQHQFDKNPSWARAINDSMYDRMLPELAPSEELWYAYHSTNIGWDEFSRRYRLEIHQHARTFSWLSSKAAHETITLLGPSNDREKAYRNVLADEIIKLIHDLPVYRM